jgi:hypothetical protein
MSGNDEGMKLDDLQKRFDESLSLERRGFS